MIVRLRQCAFALDVLRVIVRIRVAVQITADHRLRLIPFGDLHRLDVFFRADPGIETEQSDIAGAVQQGLRQDRVVIVGRRQVAVGAGLGFSLAHGMREMRRERLARVSAGCGRRLLNINTLAIGIGR